RLDQKYFNYLGGLTMTSAAFNELFGGPPREPESKLTQREMDLARSIQVVCEEVMLRMARTAHLETRAENLVLAGGVALNCVGNGRVLREGPFKCLWVQPAAGDAGGALGVAQLIAHRHFGRPRVLKRRWEVRTEVAREARFATLGHSAGVIPDRPLAPSDYSSSGSSPADDSELAYTDSMQGAYLGPEYSPEEIESYLKSVNARYRRLDRASMIDEVAELIADEKVIGWFNGRMEFGPRALGNRSIIGDPRSSRMQAQMNLKIKFRESLRPFAPSVLRERVHE